MLKKGMVGLFWFPLEVEIEKLETVFNSRLSKHLSLGIRYSSPRNQEAAYLK